MSEKTEPKHRYTKSWGDGSPRGFCCCGKPKEDIIHSDENAPEFEGNDAIRFSEAPCAGLKCPDCTLPVLANEEFCIFCNHRLKVAGAGGVDPTAISNNAGGGGRPQPCPAIKTKKEGIGDEG